MSLEKNINTFLFFLGLGEFRLMRSLFIEDFNGKFRSIFLLCCCWSWVIDCNGLVLFWLVFSPQGLRGLEVFFRVFGGGCSCLLWVFRGFLFACLFVLKRLAMGRSWGQCSHGRGKRRGAFINDCSVGCGRLQQRLHTAIWDATAAICSAIWGSVRQDCGVPFSCSRGSRFVAAVIPHKFSALCWQGQGRSPCSTPKRTT